MISKIMDPYHNSKGTHHRDIGDFPEETVSAVSLELFIEVEVKGYRRYFPRKGMHHMQILQVRKHNRFGEFVEGHSDFSES